ncbi:MAG: hypothetical protein Tsb002_37910 [Wenzhouxiangellaceae bacterium]
MCARLYVVLFFLLTGSNGIASEKLLEKINRCENEAVLDYINNNGDLNSESWINGFPILSALLYEGRENAAQLLLKGGASLTTNNFNTSPLHIILTRPDLSGFLVWLIKNNYIEVNAKVESFFKKNVPLIAVSADAGAVNIVQTFIDQGADVNATDSNKDSVLHYAVDAKQIEIVKLLIASGADVSVINAEGDSLLHYAIYDKDIEMITLLVKSGIELCKKNNMGLSAIDLAKISDKTGSISHLLHALGASNCRE